jgi:WD40 repeat protein
LFASPPSATYNCHFDRIKHSPDGKYIAAVARNDPRIFVWGGVDGMFLTTLAGHIGDVKALAFSADSLVLASVSSNGGVILWDMRTVSTRPHILAHSTSTKSHTPIDIVFNADGTQLALIYGIDKYFSIRIWDVSFRSSDENMDRAEVGIEISCSEATDGDSPHFIRFLPREPLVLVRAVLPGAKVRIWDHASDTVEEISYDEETHSKSVLPYDVDDGWIVSTKTKRRLFWLPKNRRPSDSCMVVHGERLAIASTQGIFTLLDLSRLGRSE